MVPGRRFTGIETRLPEDVINNDQCSVALIASDVNAVESTVGLVGTLGSVVYLDRRDRAAGLIGVMHGRHGCGKRVEIRLEFSLKFRGEVSG